MFCIPGWTQTNDLKFRKLLLYSAELRELKKDVGTEKYLPDELTKILASLSLISLPWKLSIIYKTFRKTL